MESRAHEPVSISEEKEKTHPVVLNTAKMMVDEYESKLDKYDWLHKKSNYGYEDFLNVDGIDIELDWNGIKQPAELTPEEKALYTELKQYLSQNSESYMKQKTPADG